MVAAAVVTAPGAHASPCMRVDAAAVVAQPPHVCCSTAWSMQPLLGGLPIAAWQAASPSGLRTGAGGAISAGNSDLRGASFRPTSCTLATVDGLTGAITLETALDACSVLVACYCEPRGHLFAFPSTSNHFVPPTHTCPPKSSEHAMDSMNP